MNLLGPEGSAKLRTMSRSRGYCRLKQTKHPRKLNPCGGYGSEAAINSHKEQLCHFQEFSRVWAYKPLMFSEIRRDKNKPLDHF